MEEITSIGKYNSAYEILEDLCDSEFWNEIDENDDIFLRHFDDFEGYAYFVINNETIYGTECCGGDVVFSCPKFEDFLRHIMSLLKEDREEREDEK